MTKTLNQIFFSSTKIRIFFQQQWESEYNFRKKNIPLPWKLNGSSLMNDTDVERTSVLGFKFTKCFDL